MQNELNKTQQRDCHGERFHSNRTVCHEMESSFTSQHISSFPNIDHHDRKWSFVTLPVEISEKVGQAKPVHLRTDDLRLLDGINHLYRIFVQRSLRCVPILLRFLDKPEHDDRPDVIFLNHDHIWRTIHQIEASFDISRQMEQDQVPAQNYSVGLDLFCCHYHHPSD